MGRLRYLFLKGLAAILPIGLTLYLVYWLGVTLEQLLGGLFKLVLPDRYYVPGLGLATGIVLVLLIGLAVNAWIVRALIRLGEALLERIPLVKSIYGAVRDLMAFFSAAGDAGSDMNRVVTIDVGGMQLIGFLTRDRVAELQATRAAGDDGDPLVAVYLPMSYQIGGYTLFLPRSRVKPIGIDSEDAMRLVLTAGLGKREETAPPGSPDRDNGPDRG